MATADRPAGTNAADSASRGSLRTALSELPLGMTGALFGLLLLARVYAVAHYSLTTTTGLVSAAPTTVFLGTIASYAYLFVTVLAFVSLFLWLKAGAFALGNLWSIILLSSFVIFSLISPWYFWWRVGLIATALTAIVYIREPVSVSRNTRARWRAAAAAIHVEDRVASLWRWVRRPLVILALDLVVVAIGTTVFVQAVVNTLDQPWWPGEVVVFAHPQVIAEKQSDANRTVVTSNVDIAYVVGTDGPWTKLLDTQRRFLFQVRSSDIRARYICRVEGEVLLGRRPLLMFLQGRQYFSPNRDCASLASLVGKGAYPVVPGVK